MYIRNIYNIYIYIYIHIYIYTSETRKQKANIAEKYM